MLQHTLSRKLTFEIPRCSDDVTYLLGRVWAAALVGGGVVVASVGYSVWSARAVPGTALSGNMLGWKF